MAKDYPRPDEPSQAMVDHLARRLVDRYGPDAPAEAEQIVRLLRGDGNDEQAEVWARVGDACDRMVQRSGKTPSKS